MKYNLIYFLMLLNTLTSSGKSFIIDKRTCIVANVEHSSVINLASMELQYFIEKVSGIKIPIEKNPSKDYKKFIYIGENHLKEFEKMSSIEWKEQEYLIDVLHNRIILAGDDFSTLKQLSGRDNTGIVPEKDRITIDYGKVVGYENKKGKITLPSIYDSQGTCYAVYDFIERFLGVRFYGPHPNNVYISKKDKIVIDEQVIRRSPKLKYRNGTYSFGWPIIKDQYFDATPEMEQLFIRRMRMGGRRYAANHAFTGYQDRFLRKNPNRPELFETHRPEFFAKGRNGGASERQFCYTNREFIKQVAKDAIKYFKGEGIVAEQIALGDYFSVVPLDNANWCTCEECQRMLDLDKDNIVGEHFNNGTATHYIWNFINEVAKEVKKEVPDKKISTLAYHAYAHLPSDINLEGNIAVAPCLQCRNYWAPKIEESEMRFYKDWIEDSKKTGRDIFLWNYLCFPTERGLLIGKYNVFPGFNIHKTGNQLKMYANDGVKGLFLCGIGEQLDFYITMKLMDDSSLSIDSMIDEFFNLYFGDAAVPMKNFYNKIESIYSSPGSYSKEIQERDAQFHQDEEIAWKYLGTPSVMKELEGYIESAKSSVVDENDKLHLYSWIRGIWNYMMKGYKQYNKKK